MELLNFCFINFTLWQPSESIFIPELSAEKGHFYFYFIISFHLNSLRVPSIIFYDYWWITGSEQKREKLLKITTTINRIFGSNRGAKRIQKSAFDVNRNATCWSCINIDLSMNRETCTCSNILFFLRKKIFCTHMKIFAILVSHQIMGLSEWSIEKLKE
jgi:hypothetical protein